MTTPTLITRPLLTRAFRVRAGSPLFIASSVFIGIVALAALAAPILPIQNPTQLAFDAPLALPSAAHLLGTDASGRDTLARLIWGAQSALVAPLVIVIVSTLLGTAVGLIAGWFGGWTDRILSRVIDIIFAFPGLLIGILAVAIFGKGIVAPVIAMCIAYTPYIARLVRNITFTERNRPYIAAYRVQGFSTGAIVLRGLLPNIIPTISAQAALNFGYALLDLAALSFLGLGVQPPTADWGAMINDARTAMLAGSPLPALLPSLAVVLTVVAFTVIGENLAERFSRRRS